MPFKRQTKSFSGHALPFAIKQVNKLGIVKNASFTEGKRKWKDSDFLVMIKTSLFPFQTLTEIEKTNKNVNEQPLTHHLTVWNTICLTSRSWSILIECVRSFPRIQSAKAFNICVT